MAKRRIELRKPQYVLAKEGKLFPEEERANRKLPFFFRILLFASYALSLFAGWYVYQKFTIQP